MTKWGWGMATAALACLFNTNAGCNAPGGINVTLNINGPAYVEVGSTNEYTLTFNPSNVNTNNGTFTWTHTGFTALGSTTTGKIKLIAPTTPSTVLNDKTIKCEFSKTGWSSASDCSKQKKVTVIKIDVDSSSITPHANSSATAYTTTFGIDGGANWFVTLLVTPSTVVDQVDTRIVQTAIGYHKKLYRTPQGAVGQRKGSAIWNFDGSHGPATQNGGVIMLYNYDNPVITASNQVYSGVESDLQFELYIQYKLPNSQWNTLEKGAWESIGSATSQSDGQGGYTLSGGCSNTVTLEFAPSTSSPVDSPKTESQQWEEY